jgi:hypothetical protein
LLVAVRARVSGVGDPRRLLPIRRAQSVLHRSKEKSFKTNNCAVRVGTAVECRFQWRAKNKQNCGFC